MHWFGTICLGFALARAAPKYSEPENITESDRSAGLLNFNTIPVTGGRKVIDELNDYRSRAGLKTLNWLPNLAQNSYNTGALDSKVQSEVHDLKPSSLAECITWGIVDSDLTRCKRSISPYTPFGLALLSWLCERPADPAIGANCANALTLGDYVEAPGDYGHHDAIANGAYSNVGCWYTQNGTRPGCSWSGFWVCEFN